MNNFSKWWQKMFIGLGFFVAATAAFSGSEASTPAHYDTAMVDLLSEMHDYARKQNPNFQFLANGGSPLFLEMDGNTAENVSRMQKAVDGQLVESVYYGFDMKDGHKTPSKETVFFQQTLDAAKAGGLPVFVLDYVKDARQAKEVEQKSLAKGYIPLATPYRGLDKIPSYPVSRPNDNNVTSLANAQNYMIVLNPDKFSSVEDFLATIQDTDYDMLIIDLYAGNRQLTRSDVEKLQHKKNGARRLVVAYMSVGEAETYRHYWRAEWTNNPPSWMDEPNADWQDNYRVKYWRPEWKHLLYGSPESYLDKIIAAGFDGTFLDVIDVYQYYQDKE